MAGSSGKSRNLFESLDPYVNAGSDIDLSGDESNDNSDLDPGCIEHRTLQCAGESGDSDESDQSIDPDQPGPSNRKRKKKD